MTRPVLMVVDDDPGSLGTLDNALRRRYDRDYAIISEGTGKLETLTLKDARTGSIQTVPASALVVLIGATPHTGWLPPRISRDEHGFILTGSDLPETGNPPSTGTPPRSLETSMPGVFAAGDVRQGSVKRVASAVGEGSIAATQMYQYVHEQARNSSPQT